MAHVDRVNIKISASTVPVLLNREPLSRTLVFVEVHLQLQMPAPPGTGNDEIQVQAARPEGGVAVLAACDCPPWAMLLLSQGAGKHPWCPGSSWDGVCCSQGPAAGHSPSPSCSLCRGRRAAPLAPRKPSTTKRFPAELAGGNTPSKPSSRWLFGACFAQPQDCCNSSGAAVVLPGAGLALCSAEDPRPSPGCGGQEGPWHTGVVKMQWNGVWSQI